MYTLVMSDVISYKNKSWLITGIIGSIIGIGLLFLAKYMLTNYAYSLTQTHRSHMVNYAGKAVSLLGLLLIVVYFVKFLVSRQPHKK